MAGIDLRSSTSQSGASSGASLTPTATKAAAYTAAAGDLAMMNVSGGATALTLPAAPADKAQVGYRAIGASTAVPLTVTAGGSDTIGTTGATSASIVLADEVTVLQYDAANTRWLGVGNIKPQTSLDARYATATVINIKDAAYGAKCDYREVTDGGIPNASSGSFTLTCATSAPFTPADVGKLISISAATSTGKILGGTITAYISATQVTVTSTQNPVFGSGKTVAWGTDDLAAIQAAVNAAAAQRNPTRIIIPGHSAVSNSIVIASKCTFAGYGPAQSGLHCIHAVQLPLFSGTTGTASVPYVDLQFLDLEMDGRSMVNSVYGVGMKALYIQYVRRLRVRGCYIHDFPATGMGCDFLEHYDVSNNVCINNGRLNNGTTDLGGANIGIATGSTLDEGGIVHGNICIGAKRYGIFLESGNTSRKHRIIGNYCSGNKDGIGDCGSQGTIIQGNQTIANTRYGIVHNGGTNAGVSGWESTVTGNLVTDNTSHGIYYDGSAASATATQAGRVLYANNSVRRNGGDGIHIDVTTKTIPRIEILNNASEENTGYGVSLAQPSGTALLTAAKVVGNSLLGNTAGAYSNALTLPDLVVRNNEGLNPQGPAAITVGASPYTYTAGNSPEVVYIDGGTVSTIIKGGTTLRSSTGAAVPLAPNESVVVTYSAAPTMVKDRQ